MRAKLRLTCSNGCGDVTVAAGDARVARCRSTDTYAVTYRCPTCGCSGRNGIGGAAAARCVVAGIAVTDTERELAADLARLAEVSTIADMW